MPLPGSEQAPEHPPGAPEHPHDHHKPEHRKAGSVVGMNPVLNQREVGHNGQVPKERPDLSRSNSPTGGSETNNKELSDAAVDVVLENEPDAQSDLHTFTKAVDQYPLNTSVWDCVLWVGLFDSWTVSIELIILTIANVVVQVGYIWFNMAQVRQDDPWALISLTDLKGMYTWRIGIAHKAEWYDVQTQTSLARRVCNEYSGAIQATSQAAAHDSLASYLPREDAGSVLSWHVNGPGLLVLSLGLWCLKMLEELCSLWGFARMLVALKDSKTRFVMDDDGGSIQLKSLRRQRVVASFFFVVLPRLAIVVTLFGTGVLYLINTRETEDIILNAIAMSFVLEIDELLYSFAPAQARHVVENADPIDLHEVLSRSLNLADAVSGRDADPEKANSIVRKVRKRISSCIRKTAHKLGQFTRAEACVCVLLAIVLWFYTILGPQTASRLQHAQAILCAGNPDFIYGISPLTAEVAVATTVDKGDDWTFEYHARLPEDSILWNSGLCDEPHFVDDDLIEEWGVDLSDRPDVMTIRQQCDNIRQRFNQWGLMYLEGSDSDARELTSMSLQEAESQVPCVDADSPVGTSYRRAAFVQNMREFLDFNVPDSLTCAELHKYCVWQPDSDIFASVNSAFELHRFTKLFCPETCKCHCDTAASCNSTDWPFQREYCPSSCLTLRVADVTALADSYRVDPTTCPVDHQMGLDRDDAGEVSVNLDYLGIPHQFLHEVMDYMVATGRLNATYSPVESIRSDFQSQTHADFVDLLSNLNQGAFAGCELSDAAINLTLWAAEAPSCNDADQCDGLNEVCSIIPMIVYIFGVNLCQQTGRGANDHEFGSLRGLCPVTCGIAPNTCPIPTASRWWEIVPEGRDARYGVTCVRQNYVCYKFELDDSAGDSWNGAELRIRDVQSVTQRVLTLDSGLRHEETDLCLLAGNSSNNDDGCYFLEVNEGEKPEEVSWRILTQSDGSLVTSGGAPASRSLCSDGDALAGPCGLWVHVDVILDRSAPPVDAVVLGLNDPPGTVTVTYGQLQRTLLYEDVPQDAVWRNGEKCSFNTTMETHNAFTIAGMTKAEVNATEELLCYNQLPCGFLVGYWEVTCEAKLDAQGCLTPPGQAWTHTVREKCPLACASQDAGEGLAVRRNCECETGLHNWCYDLNDVRSGVSNVSSLATSSCYDDPMPRTGSANDTLKWCYVDPRCGKQGAFPTGTAFWRTASAEECMLDRVPAASSREDLCWRTKGGNRGDLELPQPFACPRHCNQNMSDLTSDAPWATPEARDLACSFFWDSFGEDTVLPLLAAITITEASSSGNLPVNGSNSTNGSSSNETQVDEQPVLNSELFCQMVASNDNCNCEECSSCNQFPWVVLGEQPPGACQIDANGCFLANSVDNAHCEVFVKANNTLAIQEIGENDWDVEMIWDYLLVNGRKYSGERERLGLEGVVPSGRLIWSTDESVRSGGFKLCLG